MSGSNAQDNRGAQRGDQALAREIHDERAGFVLAAALQNLRSGGLDPLDAGFDAVFETDRQPPGRVLKSQDRWLRMAPQALPAGKHVAGGMGPTQTKFGLLWESGSELPPSRLQALLIEQSRQPAMGFVYLVSDLTWLPILGFLGVTYLCRATDEPTAEFIRRAINKYSLDAVLDGTTSRPIWQKPASTE